MIFCQRPQSGIEPFLPATYKVHQRALKVIYRMFKILIVDPNTPFRKSLIKSLSSQFPAAELRDAATGEEGLKQMNTFAPQLIFMDFYIPDISGLDLAKKSAPPIPKSSWPFLYATIPRNIRQQPMNPELRI